MMTATDRFKRLLADALERVCVLEAELEQERAKNSEHEAEQNGATKKGKVKAHDA